LDAQAPAKTLQELEQRIGDAETVLTGKVGSSTEVRGLWADLMLSQLWLWLGRLWQEGERALVAAEQRANDALETQRQQAVALATAEQSLAASEQRCEALKLEVQEVEASSATVRETVERGFQQELERLGQELLAAQSLASTLESAQLEAANVQSAELVEQAQKVERLSLALQDAEHLREELQAQVDALQQQLLDAQEQAEHARTNNSALEQAKHQNKQLQAELAAARELAGDAEQSARQELTRLAQENGDAIAELRRMQQLERTEYARRIQAAGRTRFCTNSPQSKALESNAMSVPNVSDDCR
jgi:chromosome segregation ATPase